MKRCMQVLLPVLLVSAVVASVGCQPTDGRAATVPAGSSGSPSDVVAVVAGEELTLGEIEEVAAGGLIRVRQDRYDLLRGTLERLGIEKLMEKEAAARGITADELRLIEIDGKIQEPTEREMLSAYEANKHRARGMSFQELRANIGQTLRRDRLIVRENRFIDELKKKYGFTVSLPVPRIDLPLTSDNPTRGNPDAPVTLVEFADYQCPYCRRAHPTVERVLAEYGDRIRYVFMDYPLPSHDRATPAAEAAYCAGEQDKYWEYSEHLMMMAGDLTDNDLRGRAEKLGLDVNQFMECFTSGRYAGLIADGMQLGTASGVDRTPSFFINGRLLSGAKNFETFKVIIDEELAAAGG